MVIELCGLPGSGKTTLVDAVLSEYDLDCENIKHFYRHSLEQKLYRQYLRKFYPHLMFGKTFQNYRDFIQQYPNSERIFIIRMLELLHAMNSRDAINKYYILDQGPIQALTSVPFRERLLWTSTLEKAFYTATEHLSAVIYCKCPIELCIKRIEDRSRKKDRYNTGFMSDIKNALETKDYNIQLLFSKFPGIKFSLDMTSDFCLNKDQLKNRIIDLKTH